MNVDIINKQYIFNVNIDSNGNQTVNADIVPKQLIVSVNISKGGKGDNGLSAYEIALENGFVGTEIEWLESLKGDKGGDLTLSDFSASQEVSTLEESDEFFLKRDGVFKRIANVNLKIEKSYFIPFRFYCNTVDANKYFTHDHYNNMNGGLTALATNNDDFLGTTGFCHIFNKQTKIKKILLHNNYISFAGVQTKRLFKLSIMVSDRTPNSTGGHFNKEHLILKDIEIELYRTIDLTQFLLQNQISAGKRMYAAMKIMTETPIGGYVGSYLELIY